MNTFHLGDASSSSLPLVGDTSSSGVLPVDAMDTVDTVDTEVCRLEHCTD